MAFTISSVIQGVSFGNQRVVVLRLTADAATGVINTGMKSVHFAHAQPLSPGATMPVLNLNADASGVASQGVIGVSGTSNANVIQLVVYGH